MPDPSVPAPSNAVRIAPQSRAVAEARLRAAGVRATTARLKVLGALLSANSALSHQDLRRAVVIDRVTLYRVLSSLIKAGLAHMVTGDDRISRYGVTIPITGAKAASADLHSESEHASRYRHGHFQCTLCSRMFCLEHDRKAGLLSDVFLRSNDGARHSAPEPLNTILLKTLGAGFKSHDIELIVKGWCADCAR